MTSTPPATPFPARGSAADIEQGLAFAPKFDASGLIPAIVSEASSGQVLMFAWMDAAALAKTIETRIGHFYSRSRGKPWLKGEESGNVLHVLEMRTDCDQDVVWMKVQVAGQGVACHTGETSCFYREVVLAAPAPGFSLRRD